MCKIIATTNSIDIGAGIDEQPIPILVFIGVE